MNERIVDADNEQNQQTEVLSLAIAAAQAERAMQASPDDVDGFCAVLAAASVTVSVRRPRGRDILAACGQLHLKGTEASVSG